MSKKIPYLLLSIFILSFFNVPAKASPVAKKTISEESFISNLSKAQSLRDQAIKKNNNFTYILSTDLDPYVKELKYSSSENRFSSYLRVGKSGDYISKEYYNYKSKELLSSSVKSNLFIKDIKREYRLSESIEGIRFNNVPSERLPPGYSIALLKSEGKVPFGVDTLNNYLKSRELYSNYIESSQVDQNTFRSIRENKNNECREVLTVSFDDGKLVKSKIDLLFRGKLIGTVILDFQVKAEIKPINNKVLEWEQIIKSESYKKLSIKEKK